MVIQKLIYKKVTKKNLLQNVKVPGQAQCSFCVYLKSAEMIIALVFVLKVVGCMVKECRFQMQISLCKFGHRNIAWTGMITIPKSFGFSG